MVDVADSKSAGGDTVWVRAPPPVPNKQRPHPGVLLISCLWGSNPRALSKALGALCNPRWPAAHGRSSPTASEGANTVTFPPCGENCTTLAPSSFPNRTHFVGLRFGYITSPTHHRYQTSSAPPTWGRCSFITICSLNRVDVTRTPLSRSR